MVVDHMDCVKRFAPFLAILAAIALPASPNASGTEPGGVKAFASSELHPGDGRWFTAPWKEDDPAWRYKLTALPDLAWEKVADDAGTTITVDPSRELQPITGLGTSLDETSCYAIQKGKTDAQIKDLLRSWIDPATGAGYSMFRVCFGTSDFSDARSVSSHPNGWYTYQDDQDGPFSIENDHKLGIIRVIKLAQEVAKESGVELKFFGSAWSPPGWMKQGGKIVEADREKAQLRSDMVDAYAAYLRKAVQAYEALGIPIFAVTTGNEHHYTPPQYPGCYIPQDLEASLVASLHKEFKDHHLTTQVWILDHNWDLAMPVAGEVLRQFKTPTVTADAVALHHYGGKPSQMSEFHHEFPGVPLEFTEGSVWGVKGMDEIVQIFRNWHRSYMSWVPMSTEDPTEHNQGPYNKLGVLGPTLLIQGQGSNWWKTPEYYLIAQFSKFVRPGAHRVESTEPADQSLSNVAFKNPDGSVVVVVVNQGDAERPFRIVVGGRQVKTAVPAKSAATYVFDARSKSKSSAAIHSR